MSSRPLCRLGVSRSDYERWCDAVPKLAMCLSEAGFPADVVAVDRLSLSRTPPADVLAKAAELCGIADIWASGEFWASGEPTKEQQ